MVIGCSGFLQIKFLEERSSDGHAFDKYSLDAASGMFHASGQAGK